MVHSNHERFTRRMNYKFVFFKMKGAGQITSVLFRLDKVIYFKIIFIGNFHYV